MFPLMKSGRVVFIAKSRSIDCVIRVFPDFGVKDAESFIVTGILDLNPNDFSSQSYQWESVLDIYGKRISGINWYIKFFVEQDDDGAECVSEVSFHPLEEDLKLESKVLLKKEIL